MKLLFFILFLLLMTACGQSDTYRIIHYGNNQTAECKTIIYGGYCGIAATDCKDGADRSCLIDVTIVK